MSRRQSWRVAPLAGNRRYELYMNLKTVLEDEGGLDLLDDNALAADLACFGFKVHERRKTFAGNVTVEGRHVIVDGGRDADRPICRVIAQIRPPPKMATPATKADLCKRGIPSIDLSDAVALTFAEPGGESPSDRGELRFSARTETSSASRRR